MKHPCENLPLSIQLLRIDIALNSLALCLKWGRIVCSWFKSRRTPPLISGQIINNIMKNIINILNRKKWNFFIPYGQIILTIVPAFVLLLFYKIVLLFLNTYYPNFVIEIRHFIRVNLGLIYDKTYGTLLVAFIFFIILTLAFFSFLNRKTANFNK